MCIGMYIKYVNQYLLVGMFGTGFGHILGMFWIYFGMVAESGHFGGIFLHSYPHRGVYSDIFGGLWVSLCFPSAFIFSLAQE